MAAKIKYSAEVEAQLAQLAYTDPFPGRDGSEHAETRVCGNCGGTGVLPHYYYHDNGRCYGCGGGGGRHDVTVDFVREERRKALAKARAVVRKQAREKIAFQERLDAAIALRPEWKHVKNTDNSFVHDLWMKCWKYDLTEKQINAGADAIQRELDQLAGRAASQQLPKLAEGRQTITGKIVSVKHEENNFSYHGGLIIKITVLLESGHRVFGTCPSALVDEMHNQGKTSNDLKGREVEFTAAIKHSANDNGFAIFSRPTKPRLLEAVAA